MTGSRSLCAVPSSGCPAQALLAALSGGLPAAALRVWYCRRESEHRFWKPSEVDAEVESADASEALQSRYITFAGEFEPVQHRCRAPRPDGRLCERQDRLKVRPGQGQRQHRGPRLRCRPRESLLVAGLRRSAGSRAWAGTWGALHLLKATSPEPTPY